MNTQIKLLSEDFLKLERKLYFVAKKINIIFDIDLDTGKIEFVDCIPNESIYEECLCYKILAWKNDLIFVPMNAKKIWKYEIENKKWHGIGLGRFENIKNKSFQAFIYENNLFMIGCGCPAIFQLDLITEQLIIIKEPFEHLGRKKVSSTDIFFRYNFVQKANKIFMASCQDNSVMEFDLHDKAVTFYKIGNEKNKYSGIAWDGNNFWISPRYKTSIVKWNGKSDVVEYNLPDKVMEEEIGFLGIVNTNYGLLLYGKNKYSILISESNKKINMQVIPGTYVFMKREGNSVYSLDSYGNFSIKGSDDKRIIELLVDKSSLKKFQLEKKYCGTYFIEPKHESVFFDINDLITDWLRIRLKPPVYEIDKIGLNVWNKLN